MTSEVVAVDGATAVARRRGALRRPGRPLAIATCGFMRFAADGRCRAFEEWPFHPGQPYTAAGDD